VVLFSKNSFCVFAAAGKKKEGKSEERLGGEQEEQVLAKDYFPKW
jgi:hypothetical protein